MTVESLKHQISMPWVTILDRWKVSLSKKLGRSAEEIVKKNLLPKDFSHQSVHIHFSDGSDLNFQQAFALGEPKNDGSIHRVVVFSINVGYHEFWIGPDDKITTSTKCQR